MKAGVWRISTDTYDQVNRLVGVDIQKPDTASVFTQYYYDGAGNWIGREVYSGPGFGYTSYSYGAGANQITSVTLPGSGGTIDYTYDANGNRITKSIGALIDTYSYDLENRLVSLEFNTRKAGPRGRANTVAITAPGGCRGANRGDPLRIAFAEGTSVQECGSGSTPVVNYLRGPSQGYGDLDL